MEPQSELLTIGIAATLIGCGIQHHHLHRLCVRKAIPFRCAGKLRLVFASDLPAIRVACEQAGYIRTPAATLETVPA